MLSRLSCPNRVNNHELNTIGARIDRIKLSINKFVVSLKPRIRVMMLKISYENYCKKEIRVLNKLFPLLFRVYVEIPKYAIYLKMLKTQWNARMYDKFMFQRHENRGTKALEALESRG